MKKTKQASKAQKYKAGDVVYYAALTVDNAGEVIRCEVRKRYVTKYIPNYLGKYGPHYEACKAESAGKGGGYGLAYKPEALHATQAEAEAKLLDRMQGRIAKIAVALAKFKSGSFVE